MKTLVLTDEFLAYLKSLNRSRQTLSTYKSAIGHFDRYLHKQKIQMANLPDSVLEDFVVHLSRSKYKTNSLQTITSGVRAYLEFVSRRGVQTAHVYRPKGLKSSPVDHYMLTRDQIVYILEVLKEWEHMDQRTYIAILATTGLRANEARQLQVSDFENRDGVIFVNVRAAINEENVGKGGKGRRVPMIAQGKPFLIYYLKHRKNQKSPWMFPSTHKENARPVSKRLVFMWVKKLATELDLPIEPHTFRRGFMNLHHEAGVDALTIAAMVGHSRLSTTQIYVKPSDTTLSKAAKDTKIE